MAEMLVLAEEAFGLKISDDDVKNLTTIASAVEYLDKRLAK